MLNPNIPTVAPGDKRNLYLTKSTCDQEAWITDVIKKVIITGICLKENKLDSKVFDSTLDGLINGAALRIMDILNIQPEYTNLRKV